MKSYGQIAYSTVNAPHLLPGICESYTYKTADQTLEIQGEEDLAGIVLHGRKGDISFSSTPPGTITALPLRAGAELTITGITAGKILCTKVTAKWSRGQAMTMDATATHYPHITAAGVGTIGLATITLAQGSGDSALILPTDKVWFGTRGIPNTLGIVQSCTLEESVQAKDEADGATGNLIACILSGYKATCQLELLTSGALPEIGAALEAFATYRITSAEEKWQKGNTRSISIQGTLIPGIL